MCRMLGIKNFQYNKHKEILENFFELATTGKVQKGDPPGHLDGWGTGYYRSRFRRNKNNNAFVYKSGNSVVKEKKEFFKTLERISDSKILIVHLRKSAWDKTATEKNAHPFKYKKYIFAHNGTIRDYKKLLQGIKPVLKPSANALDSEVYFRYVLNMGLSPNDFYEIKSRGIPYPANAGQKRVENAFKKAIQLIKNNNIYSSLTSLFSDGKSLYAYRDYKKKSQYYTLYCAKFINSVLISSEPISNKLKWNLLKKGKLFVI